MRVGGKDVDVAVRLIIEVDGDDSTFVTYVPVHSGNPGPTTLQGAMNEAVRLTINGLVNGGLLRESERLSELLGEAG